MRTSRILLVVLALAVASGCTPAKPAGGEPAHGLELARQHARCMREHGVPEADPQARADGSIERPRYDKDGVDQATLGAAIEACRPYEPVLDGPGADEKLAALRDYAKCMREHGVEDFPDPDPNGHLNLPSEQTDPDYDGARAFCDAQAGPSAGASK